MHPLQSHSTDGHFKTVTIAIDILFRMSICLGILKNVHNKVGRYTMLSTILITPLVLSLQIPTKLKKKKWLNKKCLLLYGIVLTKTKNKNVFISF